MSASKPCVLPKCLCALPVSHQIFGILQCRFCYFTAAQQTGYLIKPFLPAKQLNLCNCRCPRIVFVNMIMSRTSRCHLRQMSDIDNLHVTSHILQYLPHFVSHFARHARIYFIEYDCRQIAVFRQYRYYR